MKHLKQLKREKEFEGFRCRDLEQEENVGASCPALGLFLIQRQQMTLTSRIMYSWQCHREAHHETGSPCKVRWHNPRWCPIFDRSDVEESDGGDRVFQRLSRSLSGAVA